MNPNYYGDYSTGGGLPTAPHMHQPQQQQQQYHHHHDQHQPPNGMSGGGGAAHFDAGHASDNIIVATSDGRGGFSGGGGDGAPPSSSHHRRHGAALGATAGSGDGAGGMRVGHASHGHSHSHHHHHPQLYNTNSNARDHHHKENDSGGYEGNGNGNDDPMDSDAFYTRILAEGPSIDEVADRATSTYVRGLLEALHRGSIDTAAVLTRLDDLARAREQLHAPDALQLRASQAQVQLLRQEAAHATLRLQEEQERSARLLHENTVLHTQEAEQRQRLTALVALAKHRGRALQQRKKSGGGGGAGVSRLDPFAMDDNRDNDNDDYDDQKGGGVMLSPMRPSNTLSLRAATNAAPSVYKTSAAALLTGPSNHNHMSSSREVAFTANAIDNDSGSNDDCELLDALRPSNSATAAHIVAITAETQSLRRQLDEQRALYERERGVRLQQEREEHRRQQTVADRQGQTIHHLQELHECALRDLVTYRHATDRELATQSGQVDWLKQALVEAIAVAEAAKRRHNVTATAASLKASERLRPMMRSLSVQLHDHRLTAQQQRQRYESAIEDRERSLAELRLAVKNERSLRRRVEERHRFEVQGVRSELDMMRQALRQVEKKVFFSNAREELAMAEERTLMEHYYQQLPMGGGGGGGGGQQ